MTYEIHEHTADVRVKGHAPTLEELFCEMAEGMMSFAGGKEKTEDVNIQLREVKVSSPDETALLVDFLNEILSLSHINKETYGNIKINKLERGEDVVEIEADLEGVEVSEFEEDIKAVTYHEAEVKKNDKGEWEASLIFDI